MHSTPPGRPSSATTAAKHRSSSSGVDVVGIGADGFEELGASAQLLLRDADVIIGAPRQLALLPDSITATRVQWPSPLVPAVKKLYDTYRGQAIVVLGSGDPMFHGIGTTLVRELGSTHVRVWPAVSSASLACARLGWAVNTTASYSVVTKPVASLIPAIESGQPFIVLGRDRSTPEEVWALLCALGHQEAAVWLLSDLGAPTEVIGAGTAAHPPATSSSLNVIAVVPGGPHRSQLPGLPDDAYLTDGQLTKQDVRALSVCALAPHPGDHLWDIGGGSGSIAIEALRAVPGISAVTFEKDPVRAERIAVNAAKLGTPQLVVASAAPEACAEQADRQVPDIVFIGGGLTQPGVFEAAWRHLRPGGRLVANAVTVESAHLLTSLRLAYGGSLVRIEISSEHAVGSFTTLKPALPVVQWRVNKPLTPAPAPRLPDYAHLVPDRDFSQAGTAPHQHPTDPTATTT